MSARNSPPALGYIPGIDGLRAVAVLAVLVYHLWPTALPGGFSGVDVFFVISGYVVSASLANRTDQSLLNYTLQFYARRMMRIFPALIGCLLLTTLATTALIPDSWLSNTTRKTGLAAFFGLSNYALIWSTDGYFSPRAEYNPFVHTWSLAVEEQFYLVFPVVFFLWLKLRSRSGLPAMFSRVFLALLWLVSGIWSMHASAYSPDEAFYLLPSRFWELASGGLLFQLWRDGVLGSGGETTDRYRIGGGLLLIAAGYAFADRTAFPFPWAVLPVLGSCLTIAGILPHTLAPSRLRTILESDGVRSIGKLSYSLYLWHWPVYVIFRWTVGLDTAWTAVSALTLSLMLATLSYRLLELPLRHNRFVFRRPDWAIVGAALLAVAVSWQTAREVFHARDRISFSVTRMATTWYPYAWPSQVNGKPCKSEEAWQDIAGAGVQIYKSGECHANAGEPHRLFVVGDSHAGAYATLLRRFTDDSGVEVRLYQSSGCSFANLLKPVALSEPKCKQFAHASLDDIAQLARPGDVVFLASLRIERIGGQYRLYDLAQVVAAQQTAESRAQIETAYREAEAQITALEKLGVHIVLEAPKPVFRSPPFRCSDWFNTMNPVCSGGFEVDRAFLLDLREPVMQSISKLSEAHPRMIVWDPFPLLCPHSICSAFDDGQPVFFDGDHLSAYGNHLLYPHFRAVFQPLYVPTQALRALSPPDVAAQSY